MQGIEKIAQRISRQADQEIEQLQAETRRQVEDILSAAREKARQEQEETLARGQRQAQERQERLESAAQMEKRKLHLAAKQELIGRAFDLAQEKLCALPDAQLIPLLASLAVKASTSAREQLIFSTADRTRIGKQVVVSANETLGDGKGMLTLAQHTREIRGGFILSDGDVEINCAFETLVRLQREALELDVAKLLFSQ